MKIKISDRLAKLIKVNDLMTKEVIFYSGEKEDITFCKNRDIDGLPDKDYKHFWRFNEDSETFTKEIIPKKRIIKPGLNIHNFILKTKNANLLFVKKNDKIVGVIHFCDLINSNAYIYFYSLFHEFETEIRKLLTKRIGTEEADKIALKWLQQRIGKINDKNRKDYNEKIKDFEKNLRKERLPPLQHLSFIDLIKFAVDNRVLSLSKTEIYPISRLRNMIMHSKDISSRQDKPNNDLLYKSEDHKKFLKVYDFLMKFLKEA